MTILQKTRECGRAAGAGGLRRSSAGATRRRATAPELPTLSVSHWTDRTELFMEHPPLVAGATVRFTVHLTTLSDFRPLNEGRPSIELTGADDRVTSLPGSPPVRPGAFRVEGAVPAAGTYRWGSACRAGVLDDFHDLGTIAVFPSAEAARAAPTPPEGPRGHRLPEGAAVGEPTSRRSSRRRRSVRRSLRVPATVTPTAGGEAVVVRPGGRPARRRLACRRWATGSPQGALLARFEPRVGSLEDRALLQQQVEEARVARRGREAERQRAERLLAERAVPARRLDDAPRALTLAQAQFEAAETRLAQQDRDACGRAARRSGGNAFDLRAPIAGTIVVGVGHARRRATRKAPNCSASSGPTRSSSRPRCRRPSADIRVAGHRSRLELPGRAELIPAAHRSAGARGRPGSLEAARAAPPLRGRQRAMAGCWWARPARRRSTSGHASPLPVVPAERDAHRGRPAVPVRAGRRRELRAANGRARGARGRSRGDRDAGVKPGDRVVTRGTYDVQLASGAKGLPAEGHVH